MSGANLTINLKEIDALRDLLNSMALTSNDRRKLLSDIGLEMEEQTRSRLTETKETPDGKPWAWYSDVTLRYLEEQGLSIDLLNRTGDLHKSLTSKLKSEWAVMVGATKEYAATHQFGAKQGEFGRASNNTPIPRGDIPAREYLGFGDNDVAELIATLELFMKGKVTV